MELTLESLGLTREELQERVIDTICTRMLETEVEFCGEDGNTEARFQSTKLADALRKTIRRKIDEGINSLALKYVIPNAEALIQNVAMGNTNAWGEPVGPAVGFKEYLAKRAEAYMLEPVDYDGKTKQEGYHSDFKMRSTRLAYMIDHHLHYHVEAAVVQVIQLHTQGIEQVMQNILKQANNFLVEGIDKAVRANLELLLKSFKAKVDIKGE